MSKTGWLGKLWHELGRIRVRLLVVNLVVLLVPVAGLEFADIYERQLLDGLERDMRNQAVLVRRLVEDNHSRNIPIDDPRHTDVLRRAAIDTRTRVRLLGKDGTLLIDSHGNGAPEGPEAKIPTLMPRPIAAASTSARRQAYRVRPKSRWSALKERAEVKQAIEGRRGAYTRIRSRKPSVFLFLSEPMFADKQVIGVVYVARSTQPVLLELYRIRSGLTVLLAISMFFTFLLTLGLAWSISRPLAKLSSAAKRIAAGERNVVVPVQGSGEIKELGSSIAKMTSTLNERMNYISDFAADVAHEFKSPLTSIRGAAELLIEGAHEDPAARTRFLNNIELDVDRLDRLVSRLLELSRIESSNQDLQQVDILSMAKQIAERSDGGILIDADETQNWNLHARRGDVETALVNLVDNARRFSPAHKKPILTLSGHDNTVTLNVRDFGPGISEGSLPKVFDRFFTTDQARQGTGLGLAIVKAVADAHHGSVHARNHPDGGAEFRLVLSRA